MDKIQKNQESTADSIDIRQYLRILKRRKWTIIITTIIAILIGIVYSIKATPIYQAAAKIQADPVQPNATAQDQYIMNSMVFLYYETQYEIIKSRKVSETVVDKLNLIDWYREEQEEAKNAESLDIRKSLKKLFSSFFELENDASIRLDESEKSEKLRTNLAAMIQSELVVQGGTQSQIIDISYQNEDPILAANIVNAVSEAYIQFGLEARLGQIKDTADWLGDQLGELKSNLRDSEEKLRTYQLAQNLIDTDQQQRLAAAQLQTLNTELVKAQTQLSQTRELYNQVTQVEENGGDFRSLGPVLESNTIRDLVREEATLNRKVQELSQRYGDKHPKMIAAISDLSSARNNLQAEAEKIIENIKKQYASAQAQESNVLALLEKTKQNLQSYQGDSFELTRLEREVENNRRIYETFLSKLMEADVSGDYDASNIRIIDKATVPEFPIKPRVSLILALCIILGVGLGVFIAFIKELSGNVFRTPDELEQELSIPSLGITPLIAKSKSNVAPEYQYIDDKLSTFSEQINTIRTGLIFSNIDSPPKTILITSTSGSEGKSTLAINLAAALSQLDKTVLLELDLRKPAISHKLNIKAKSGLTEVLTAGEPGNSIVKFSYKETEHFDLLTCGTIPKNPMEILSSNRFRRLLERLRNDYTYIVMDSPPTLPVSDSCVLSKYADATLIAVKAEDTKINAAKETVARLEKVNANIAGVILTQASAKKMSYYGEHYYQDSYYGIK